ncbi:MAG TPA: TIGR03084 family metal-binding protein [Ramlibacter sp.]|nr:TIGR03084 family metal-binding protein [Ramlibacter sp.]
MKEITADLLSEYRALADLCENLTPDQWGQRTDFHGWTPWDEIAHLLFFDETALQSATDPQRFERDREALTRELATGEEMSSIARRRFGHLGGQALLDLWRQRHEALVAALVTLDPKGRLPWYGPTMSARSFATARLMETWAHGQDVWDMLGRERTPGPGLRHITHLGVTTYGWTFVNRQLPVPQPIPYVELRAPDGSRWTWGEASDQHYVRGPALDFALLATQRRHRADTRLQWAGDPAEQWTLLAQCFAGEPANGPAPGTRVSRR